MQSKLQQLKLFHYFVPALFVISLFIWARELLLPVIFVWVLISLIAVAMSYSLNWALLFRKRQNGSLPVYIRWLFTPYLIFVHIYNLVKRLRDPVPAFQKIYDGLYVGARLNPSDLRTLEDEKIKCVLDMTAEFDGLGSFSYDNDFEYLNIPILDHAIPKRAQLAKACRWIHKNRLQGKNVLVHCAMGRGRSVLVVAAYLLAIGVADSVEQAMRKISDIRSTANLNRRQFKQLEQLMRDGCSIIKSKAVIIANPVSGGGKWKQHKEEIQDYLKPYFTLHILETTPEISAKQRAQQVLHEDYHTVIAAGGDGTVSEVANVIGNHDINLGILPMGTANSLCHVLIGIQSKITPILSACATIIRGELKHIDMAQCNDETMLLAIGVGIEEKMISHASRENKNESGQFAYIQGFINAVNNNKVLKLDVEFENEKPVTLKTPSLVIANASPSSSILAQGNGNPDFSDGLLDVTWIDNAHSPSVGSTIKSIGNLVLNTVNENASSPDICHKRVSQIHITMEGGLDYVIDGEVRHANDITVKVVPEALRVYFAPDETDDELMDYGQLAELVYSDE
ncbi:Putative lipid kinase [Thalassocella blandensis]|nr:Putative lipid kinase [Thalassocella blandensis]